MKLAFRTCGAALCLAGLFACSQTPAHTADDQTNATNQNTVSTTDPTPTTTSTELPPAEPRPTSNGVLATASDRRDPAPSAPSKDATPPAPVVEQTTPTPAPGSAPDNTKVNKRDADSAALTPMDQGNNETDLKITQQIRQAVMADGSLSFTAKNVKIITANGKVTLRGPVNTAAERSAIDAAARKVAGAQVDNQIEVKK